MRRAVPLALAVLIAAAAAAPVAGAKSAGQLASFGGVTVNGSPFRYAAFSPSRHTPGRFVPGRHTIVVRVRRDGGRIDRWWTLPGAWAIPAVSYDIHGGGGLSADGSTLVLFRVSAAYPPAVSRFAVLDTGIRADRRGGSDVWRSAAPARFLAPGGDLSFHAISPDGSTLYLAERLADHDGPEYIANPQLRALDVQAERLLPVPILDPDRGDREEGLPVTDAASPDGRWAYTLYDGNGGVPFLEALDTVRGEVASVELPRLADRRNLFMLRLRTEDRGRTVAVRGYPPDGTSRRTLVAVDSERLAVARPGEAGTGAGEAPWKELGLTAAALAAVTVWAGRRARRRTVGGPA